MYEMLNILFTLTIIGGILWAYVMYFNEKADDLVLIQSGICPKCRDKSMVVDDQKSGGCSGTKLVKYRCERCGYSDSFNIDGGSCLR
jgi:predicted nucleic-acid-binding Zn-ribbon protein